MIDLKITKEMIPLIEKAMGIKLFQRQIDTLVDGKQFPPGRRNGFTTVHCIKLALSDGEPLDLKKPEKFSDWGDGSIRYARGFYKYEFLETREKLKNFGFPVREVIK